MNSRYAVLSIKALLIASSLIAILAVGLFYGLPVFLKGQLPALIGQTIGRKTTIADIRLNVAPLMLQLDEVAIHDKKTGGFIAFEHLSIEPNIQQSIQIAGLALDKIALHKPVVHLGRNKDGVLNIQDLLPVPKPPQDTPDKPFALYLKDISLTEGTLFWQDGTSSQSAPLVIEGLNARLENLGIGNPSPKTSDLSLSFSLQSGGRFDGKASLSIQPFSSQGQLKLGQLNIARLLDAYLPIPLKINGPNNSVEADYQLSYVGNKLSLSVPKVSVKLQDIHYEQAGQSLKLADLKHDTSLEFKLSGEQWQLDAKTASLQADKLRFEDKNRLGNLQQLHAKTTYQLSYGKNQLAVNTSQGAIKGKELRVFDQEKNLAFFPELTFEGIQTNLDKHTLKIGAVSINNANLNAWLNPDGSLNLQALADNQPPSTTAITASPKAMWQIEIGEAGFKNGTLTFEDRSLPKPTTTTLQPINLTIKGYSSQTAKPLLFVADTGVNKNGSIALKGTLTLAPFATQMQVQAKNIELEKFQPYYDQVIKLDIIDGVFNADGVLSVKKHPIEPLDLQFNGNSAVENLLIRDQRVHKDFLKWEKLRLTDLAIDMLAQRYTAADLTLHKPYARITIRKDKTVNFSGLLINETPENTKNTQPKGESKPVFFKLGKINIVDGSSDFTDLSLILPFSAYIKSLDGGASGLSSDKNSQVKINLKGNAYDLAPVDITGEISPFIGKYDTKVNFQGLPMPLVSSYMVQFAGYKVEKGKMNLNLHYQIADKKLSAANNFLIDQFELGERIENPDAASLPIELAVALLKDDKGKIKLDVPLYGDLNNPQFNVGGIITDAITNALGKIIRSPFTALSSLMQSHESSLDTINFTAGSAALDANQQAKLKEIAKALLERPKLTIEIKGTTLQEQDWPAISDDALYDQLKIRRADEINKKSVRKIRAEYVELSNDDYQRLLADMFIEKFPLLAEKSLLGTPQLKKPQPGQQFYELAKEKLQEIIKPEQERLKELANDRARAIAKHLVQKNRVPHERVFILDSLVKTDKNNSTIASFLSLKAN